MICRKKKNEEEKNEGGVIGALKSAGGKIKKALTPPSEQECQRVKEKANREGYDALTEREKDILEACRWKK